MRTLRQLVAPTALGLPFSEVARHGDLLFLSGMVGIEPGTTDLVSGGVEAEAPDAEPLP